MYNVFLPATTGGLLCFSWHLCSDMRASLYSCRVCVCDKFRCVVIQDKTPDSLCMHLCVRVWVFLFYHSHYYTACCCCCGFISPLLLLFVVVVLYMCASECIYVCVLSSVIKTVVLCRWVNFCGFLDTYICPLVRSNSHWFNRKKQSFTINALCVQIRTAQRTHDDDDDDVRLMMKKTLFHLRYWAAGRPNYLDKKWFIRSGRKKSQRPNTSYAMWCEYNRHFMRWSYDVAKRTPRLMHPLQYN